MRPNPLFKSWSAVWLQNWVWNLNIKTHATISLIKPYQKGSEGGREGGRERQSQRGYLRFSTLPFLFYKSQTETTLAGFIAKHKSLINFNFFPLRYFLSVFLSLFFLLLLFGSRAWAASHLPTITAQSPCCHFLSLSYNTTTNKTLLRCRLKLAPTNFFERKKKISIQDKGRAKHFNGTWDNNSHYRASVGIL